MSTIKFDLAPQEGVTVPVVGDKPCKLYLRPFCILDEHWLSELLDGEDLFGIDDHNPRRAVAAFLHQLDDESRARFGALTGVQIAAGTREEWLSLAEDVCKKLHASQIEPFAGAISELRKRCLPEYIKDIQVDNTAKKKYLWTAIFSFALGCLVGWMLSPHFIN